MGQKANPLSLRLQNYRRTFDSCWYSDYFYAKCQSRDLNLKNYINTFFKLLKLPQARINIDYGLENVKIWTFFCQPQNFRSDLAKTLNMPGIILSRKQGLDKSRKNYEQLSQAWKIDTTTKKHSNSTNALQFLTSSFEGRKGTGQSMQPYHISRKNTKDIYLSNDHRISNIKEGFLLSNLEQISLLNKDKISLNKKLLLSFSRIFEKQSSGTQSVPTIGYVENDIIILPSGLVQRANEVKNNKHQLLHNLLALHYYKKQDIVNKNHEKLLDNKLCTNLLFNQFQSSQLNISNKHFKYRNHFENYLSSQLSNIDVQFYPFVSRQCWQSAIFLADEIVYFLERRISFSRLRNRIARQASMQPFIRGIRITCSGRVGGKSKKAQRATQEFIKYGSTGGHVFENRIDFASTSAHTPFGLLGIKVWICYK